MHDDLAKEDADKTRVAVNCDGGSAGSGAAAGMEHAMIRNRVIEMVDATLKGRPFNPALASGATAARCHRRMGADDAADRRLAT